MYDFVEIRQRNKRGGSVELYPEFLTDEASKDLMIRGGDFYAVWDENKKLWSKSEFTVIKTIDAEMRRMRNEIISKGTPVSCAFMRDASSGSLDRWHKYVQKQMRDSFQLLDQKILFANTDVKRSDRVTKTLPYSLESGKITAYEELMSTIYDPEEREKLEWAIGSIISGDSKRIQKFIVLYGGPGTGKSTFLNIVQQMFPGFWAPFNAKEMASANNTFALESFKNDPLIGIQHDGNLSKIADNTILNSIVSHETIEVNEKFRRKYEKKFNTFLLMGTNSEVQITESKAGLLRRLIIVEPSGRKIPINRYDDLMEKVKFEFGAIAHHCLEVYKERGAAYYNNYIPTTMTSFTNDLYDFLEEHYDDLKDQDPINLSIIWDLYKRYCTLSNITYPMRRIEMKKELTEYYDLWEPRGELGRNTYTGFRASKFAINKPKQVKKKPKKQTWLGFNSIESIFDELYSDCKAQYTSKHGTPLLKWTDVTTLLRDLDTKKLHYVRLPKNHIVIDFDLKNEKGEKDLERNIEAASKWPETYAELSKSGSGIHLHYIYLGDPTQLSRVYEEGIEVKVFTGNASLRRMLTRCNDISIATINSGLPLKGGKPVLNQEGVKSESKLRDLIRKNLNKEIHPGTKPSVDFIYKILEDAYASGLAYDVSDLWQPVYNFAMNSTNHSDYCARLVNKMHFKSEIEPQGVEAPDELPIVFYDVEVFPNLFLINWKYQGRGKTIVRMINPKPQDVETLYKKYRLVGFNNRRYDNHILYAWANGLSNEALYRLSQKIIQGNREAFIGTAYNLSYADIYDFSSKKQSLKKWEIELGIHHQELGLPWDQPVPEDQWIKVAEYCDNDVIATEAVFDHLKQDFNARKMLSEMSGLTVNDTTRMHITKIIFGDDKNPPLVYTDLSTIFPGYEHEDGKSSYMGEDPSQGGYVYSVPGVYGGVALLDIQSMHPTSSILLNYYGSYTSRVEELMEARIAVKHHDRETASKLLNGALIPYLGSDEDMDNLAYTLKIIINSIYGYTCASFKNPFKDDRNIDNIIAKRGALFMILLKNEVQKRGFKVAHIKTDSIKIPDATPEIISFVMDFGKQYGYTFEHEATYDKMCLVNDAVYIAKYADGPKAGKWVAVGAQFQHPYVFKYLFSKEPITFDDKCEAKTVTTAMYLDMNEGLAEGEHNYRFIGRAGLFCPIIDGQGGGELVREKDGKYYAVGGTKGYRWLESEFVKVMKKEDCIFEGYFKNLVDTAVEDISRYVDFDWFVSETPYAGELPFSDREFEKAINPPEKVDLPWNE